MANAHGSTVIGESILISGSLTGDEDLTVRGRVEGNLNLTKVLTVEASGVVKAEVQVRACIIAGVVVGNVTATESVEITKEGRMVGDIAAPRIIIVDGASFRGRIDMGDVDVPSGDRPRTTHRASAPSKPARIEKPNGSSEKHIVPARPPAPPAALVMSGMKKKVIVKRR